MAIGSLLKSLRRAVHRVPQWLRSGKLPARLRLVGKSTSGDTALQQSERLLQQFVSYAPVGIAMLDREMRYIIASQGWVEQYHLESLEAITGHSYYALFPEMPERWRQVHQRCLAGAIEHCEEDRFERADGSQQWLRWDVRPWYTPHQTIGGIIIFSEDISDRKQAEAQLQDSEERLRLTLTAANQGLYDLNVQTGEAIVNPEYATMLGYDPASFQETNGRWIERLHPDDRQPVAQIYQAYVAGEIPEYRVEFRQRTRTGQWKWILSLGKIVTWDERGNPLRMLGTHTDISAAKRNEAERLLTERALIDLNQALEARVEQRTAALRASETQLLALTSLQQAILDSADYSIISTTPDGMIQTFNAAAQTLLGYAAAEVVNRTTPELFHDPDEVQWRAEQLSAELGRSVAPGFEVFVARSRLGMTTEEEWTYIRKDGSRFPVLLSVTALHDDQGHIRGFLGIGKDITQQKQMEARLDKSAAHLATAQRIGNLGSWELDLQTQTFLWSEEVFCITGWDPARPVPTYPELQQLIHPDDRERHHQVVQQAIEQQSSYELEVRLTTLDQRLRHLLVRGETIIDDGGRAVCIVGTVLDITARKQIEMELRDLSERLALALQSGAIGTWDWDMVHEATWDDRMYEIYGLQHLGRAAVYQDWVEVLHPEDRARAEQALQAAIQGEQAFDLEFRIIRPDGALRFIKAAAILQRNPQGEPIRMVGLNYDITDRKQAELSLQQLNEELERRVQQRTQDLERQSNLLQTILNSMGDGVIVANREGQILLRNAAARRIGGNDLTGVSDLTQGSAHWGICLPDGSLCPTDQLPLFQAIHGQATDQVELLLRRDPPSDGVYLEVTGRPLMDGAETSIGGVIVIRDVTDRKRAEVERQRTEAQILYSSLHDALTNLPNRNFLTQRLELAIQRSQRSVVSKFAVLFLDLDHFKVINDSLGHLAGDRVLKMVAQKLRSLIRASDMAARLGGDEFVLLLEDIEDLQHPVHIAERLFAELQLPLLVNEREVFINTSIGIVLGSPAYQSPADLLRDADIALYRAKAQGRGRYAIFDEEMHTQALQRLQLEHALRKAIDQQELTVYYQPIVNLKTGCLYSFEALVRWQHPTQGFISPDQFIPIAEETGLITPLDHWVMVTACQQLALWHQQYPQLADLKISVNLSVYDLVRPALLMDLDEILAQTGLQGHHLNLEITESMLIKNMEAMVAVLEQLKTRRIQFSIDDFGTGYSSLSYLHCLPVDAFKVDRSFVRYMETSSRNTDIVKTILTLSNRLRLDAIAEGIESQKQFQQLQELGCELGQGYWFAQPMAAEAVKAFLEAQPLPQIQPAGAFSES